jgi:hypothetical protein
MVRHEANAASGGNVLETEVEDFLRIEGPGPEFVALRRLLHRAERSSVPE